jgi:hypothetical protein
MVGVRAGVAVLALALFATTTPAYAAEWQFQDVGGGGGGPIDVAVDPAGNSVVAWTTHWDGAVQIGYRPAGGRFSVTTLDGFGQAYVQVDADSQGHFTVVWMSGDGSVKTVVVSPGGQVGPAELIAPPAPSDAARACPALDVAPSGAAVATWQTQTKNEVGVTNTRIDGALRGANGSWDPADEIYPGDSAFGAPCGEAVQVGVDSAGVANVFFWRHMDEDPLPYSADDLYNKCCGGEWDIVIGRPGAGFGSLIPVDTDEDDLYLLDPQFAVSPGGDVLIGDIALGSEFSQVRVLSGTTTSPVGSTQLVTGADPGRQPRETRVFFDNAGNAYVSFFDRPEKIHLAERAAGTSSWVETPGIGPSGYSYLTVSDRGDVGVMWTIDQRTEVRLRPAGSQGFGSPESIPNDSYHARLAAGGGRFVVAWAGIKTLVYDEPPPVDPPPPAPVPPDLSPPRCDMSSFWEHGTDAPGFVAECSETVSLSAVATLNRPGAARRVEIATVERRLRAARETLVKLRMTRRGRKTVRRALAKHGRAVGRLTVTATDGAGNSRVLRRKLAILASE